MSNFIVIFSCLIIGVLAKNLKSFPKSSAQALNSFVIYLSLPCLILAQVPPLLANLEFNSSVLIPVSLAWIHFALVFVTFHYLGKSLKWSSPKIGALILTVGLGNTSFVGIPLLEAIIGPEATPIALIVDQPGSFLVLSTLGILVAANFSGNTMTSKMVARRVFTFPPFLALLLSVVWVLFKVPGFEILSPVFGKVGSTLVPIALFAVGFQLSLDKAVLRKRWIPLTLGLGFKLILAPILFYIMYTKFWKSDELITQVVVLESAMAPMITSAVVASEFNLDSEIANLMVGVGIPLSLLTVPLWDKLLF